MVNIFYEAISMVNILYEAISMVNVFMKLLVWLQVWITFMIFIPKQSHDDVEENKNSKSATQWWIIQCQLF